MGTRCEVLPRVAWNDGAGHRPGLDGRSWGPNRAATLPCLPSRSRIRAAKGTSAHTRTSLVAGLPPHKWPPRCVGAARQYSPPAGLASLRPATCLQQRWCTRQQQPGLAMLLRPLLLIRLLRSLLVLLPPPLAAGAAAAAALFAAAAVLPLLLRRPLLSVLPPAPLAAQETGTRCSEWR